MLKKSLAAAAFAIASVSVAPPAFAQAQSGLVNVSIGDVTILNNFLNAAQIAALSNIGVPINVQAPIGVAANVCGVSAAVLAQAGSAAQCDATSGSMALAQIVNRQVLSQAM